MTRTTARQRIADLFKAQPCVWISALLLAEVGGLLSSRTRISECRRQLGMDITNRLRSVKRADGTRVMLSEFRFTPPVSSGSLPLFSEDELRQLAGHIAGLS